MAAAKDTTRVITPDVFLDLFKKCIGTHSKAAVEKFAFDIMKDDFVIQDFVSIYYDFLHVRLYEPTFPIIAALLCKAKMSGKEQYTDWDFGVSASAPFTQYMRPDEIAIHCAFMGLKDEGGIRKHNLSSHSNDREKIGNVAIPVVAKQLAKIMTLVKQHEQQYNLSRKHDEICSAFFSFVNTHRNDADITAPMISHSGYFTGKDFAKMVQVNRATAATIKEIPRGRTASGAPAGAGERMVVSANAKPGGAANTCCRML